MSGVVPLDQVKANWGVMVGDFRLYTQDINYSMTNEIYDINDAVRYLVRQESSCDREGMICPMGLDCQRWTGKDNIV